MHITAFVDNRKSGDLKQEGIQITTTERKTKREHEGKMALRLRPSEVEEQRNGKVTTEATGSESVSGVHDTMRYGLNSIAADVNCQHPLKASLAKWDEQQMELRMEIERRTFGMHEPIRKGMEAHLTRETDFVPLALGGPSNMHYDILNGTDSTIDVADIYPGECLTSRGCDVQRGG